VRIVHLACGIYSTFSALHGNADLALIEPGLVKLGDGLFGVIPVFKHADDGRTLLSFHGR
jgi:hypothetical protein